MTLDPGIPGFSFADGGRLRRLEEAAGITRHDDRDWLRRAGAFLLIAYLPVLVLSIVVRLVYGYWDPVLLRIAVHVRALVVVPLLLFGEGHVDIQARRVGSFLLASGIIGPDQLTAFRTLIARIARARESGLIEALFLAGALLSVVPEVRGPVGTSLPGLWNALVGISVFRFLMLRWVWRWLTWALLLRGISRLRLELRAIHPDQAGGLGVLEGPHLAFSAFILACGSMIAASWADRMLREGVGFEAFYSSAVVFVVLAVLIAVVPLQAFAGTLYRLRRDGLWEYGVFASHYCQAFQERTMARGGQEALGSDDISALADLISSYGSANQIQATFVSLRLIRVILVAAVLPLIPLLLTEIELSSLLTRLVKALV